jgi:hypothetical protein
VKLMSKPSVQRCMGVKQLLSTRRNLPPGIFLLSTTQVGFQPFLRGGDCLTGWLVLCWALAVTVTVAIMLARRFSTRLNTLGEPTGPLGCITMCSGAWVSSSCYQHAGICRGYLPAVNYTGG